MDSDTTIVAGMRAMMNGIAVPPTPVIASAFATPRRKTHGTRAAAAVAACIVLAAAAVPLTSRSIVETLEQKIYQIIGFTPPKAPATPLDGAHARIVSLDEARGAAGFPLVAPTGLPADAQLKDIMMLPTATYGQGAWSKNLHDTVQFEYARGDGRMFSLIAAKRDPSETYSKYMFEDVGSTEKSGPRLKRFNRVVWSNGDQVIAVIDDGISVEEIDAIRTSMGGVPIPTVWPLKHGRVVKIVVGKP
jgi:hypothetical protein